MPSWRHRTKRVGSNARLAAARHRNGSVIVRGKPHDRYWTGEDRRSSRDERSRSGTSSGNSGVVTTATVIGSGPNGLAAAVRLARAGVEVTVLEAADSIGGGVRSVVVDGLIHDQCSAVHAVAVGSPFFRELDAEFDLAARGLRFLAAPVDCAHPLDDGTTGVLLRGVAETAEANGSSRWDTVFQPVVEHFDGLVDDIMRPLLHVPRHPVSLARFGIPSAVPATVMARLWETPRLAALWQGVAAHLFHRLDRPMSSAVAMMIIAGGHANGWVVAEGGSQRIAEVLGKLAVEHGARIETGVRVRSLDQIPSSDILMLDTSPGAAADLLGRRLPDRVAKAYRRFRHGPGAFKVDFAVDGGIPWISDESRRAATVHLGGTAQEVTDTESQVVRGRMPERPFVLVGQQYLADPSRCAGATRPATVPIWSYAHVPNGYTGDATEAIIAQIERFAPGFRERIVSTLVRSTTDMAVKNPNYVGGDIIGGAASPLQLVFRPRFGLDPYATGIDGVYLCSASTPPGAGAHGMGGANAADRALASL